MVETYAQKYRRELDEVKNELFNLFRKFTVLQGELTIDYKEGLISEEVYKRLSREGITSYVEGEYSKYFLSKEEVKFIKENGLVEGSELSIKLVPDNVEEKAGVLESICHSAIKGTELSNLSNDALKKCIIDEFEIKYRNHVGPLESTIGRLSNAYGDNAIFRPDYSQAKEELSKATASRTRLLDKLEQADRSDLIGFAFQLFEVNKNYYGWFESKRSKEELETGTSFSEASTRVSSFEASLNDTSKDYEVLVETITQSQDNIKTYNEFMEKFYVDTSIWYMFKNVKKATFESKKKYSEELNAEYRKVFEYMYDDSIVKSWVLSELSKTDKEDEFMMIDENGNNVLDMNTLFAKFMEKFFKDTIVTVPEYIKFIRDNAKEFGAKRLDSNLRYTSTYVNSFNTGVDELVVSARRATACVRSNEAYVESYRNRRNYVLPSSYVSFDEEELLYSSIKDVINQDLSQDVKLSYKK